MNAVLFLSLVIILGAALWPKNSYRRRPHQRLWDQQKTPTYETKVYDHEALQRAAVKLKALDVQSTRDAWQKAAVNLCDGKSETYAMQSDALIREFGERWIARAA